MSDNKAVGEGSAGWGWIAVFAVFAMLLRIMPRYFPLSDEFRWLWNFSAVGGLGLFAGARFRSRGAFFVPVGVMLISDLLLIYPLSRLNPPQPAFNAVTWVVYACLLFNVLLGRFLKDAILPVGAGLGGLLTATVFFVGTNLGEWAFGGWYPRTSSGLVECFVAALPFFKNTLAGDLIYSALFFGLFAAVQIISQRQKVSQPA